MKELKKTRYYITHSILLLGLTFCGFNSVGGALFNKDHACEYGEWETVKEATCAESGELVRYCQTDPTHYQKKIIEASGGHNYEDFVCTGCGATQVSQGLDYQRMDDGYEIVGVADEELSDGEVSIPAEIDGVPVVGIGAYAFYGKYRLERVKIPDTVTYIGYEAFAGCGDLTKVIMGNSVDSMGEQVFRNCQSLTSVELSEALTEIPYGAFASCSSLTEVELPESVTSIYGYAFYNCSSLQNVVIPESVTAIYAQAFYCCPLTSVELLNPEISVGDSAFYGCAPKKIVVPASALINLGSMQNVEEVVITSSANPENDYIPYALFNGASKLKKITLPFIGSRAALVNDYYQYPFGYIFGSSSYANSTATQQYYHYENLSSTTNSTYYIPNSLKSVTVTGGEVLLGAFYNCSNLTSVTLPEATTSIGNVAFYHCTSLESINIGENLQTIGARAFEGCSSLTGVELADGLTYIGEYAFASCSGLERVRIPASVTSVAQYAFYNCLNLTIDCDSAAKPTGWSDYWNPSGLTVYWNGELEEKDGLSFENARSVGEGTHSVVISQAGNWIYFKFVPMATKSYTIRSSGDYDTYGYLYNSSKTQLTANDDGAGSGQFKITYSLTAGQTYYIAVRLYSTSATGNFTVTIS